MSPEETTKKSRRPTFADSVKVSTTGEVSMVLPSDIRADHTRNDSRGGWAPYAAPDEIAELLNGPCNFTLAEIEQKLSSLLLEGQISEIECYIDEKGIPVVKIGYLRHCAMLLAEARGILGSIPTTARTKVWGVRVKLVPRPKTQNDWDLAADRNYAENAEHLPPTPVQFAFYCKRKLAAFNDDGVALYTRKTLAQKLSMSGRRVVSERMINQHLQLLKAHPNTLLAVHEGRMKMADALREMKANGELATRQSRASQRPAKPLAPAAIIRAIEHCDKRPPPSQPLTTSAEMVLLDRLVCGLAVVDDDTPELVREWYEWKAMSADEAKTLTPEKPAREPKTSRKKSPGVNAKEQADLAKASQALN